MSTEKPKLLIVEDDAGMQKQLRWAFDDLEVLQAANRSEAMAALRRHEPAVVLQDLGLPPDPDGVSEGLATLKEMLLLEPDTKVIVFTGNADRDNALRAVGLGAYDFYQKPVDVQMLRLIVTRAQRIHDLEQQNRMLRAGSMTSAIEGVLTSDPGMLRACGLVHKVATTSATVLILGESGTGKELFAHAVHQLSPRRKQRFVAINCAAIPEQLLESELFGFEKGAFTGAVKTTPGKIEGAHEGTLFLDEIGDMPLPLQAKLLRFLQQRVIERVGGRHEIPVDVRVVCATNRDLKELIAEQKFREDLYYRISELPIALPPLRDRAGDASHLAQIFLKRFSAQFEMPKRGFTAEALIAIQAYPWPGNVRELENRVKTSVLTGEGMLITAADMGIADAAGAPLLLTLKDVRARAELQALKQALAMTDGNMSKAAELLGISRPTLYDLMDKAGLRPPRDGT